LPTSITTNKSSYHLAAFITVTLLSVLPASSKSPLLAPGNKTASQTATATDAAQIFDLSDFGAVGDGVADDGPALQRALDALAKAGGGTLLVPEGRYAIATPVSKDFTGLASSVRILGVESLTPVAPATSAAPELARGLDLVSEIYPRTGEEQKAIGITGLQNFLIRDIAFLGTQTVLTDAVVTLFLTDIKNAVIRHCEFYGLATFIENGAIVKAVRSHLNIDQSKFLGSTAASGLGVPVVENIEWRGVTVTHTHFVDYGQRPDFYSKTGLGAPFSWINMGNAAQPESDSPRREVIIRDVFLDEGAYVGITCLPYRYGPPSAPIDLIYITGLRMNVPNFRTSGHLFYDARRVLVEKSSYEYSHNADSAVSLISVGNAILDQLTCVANADRIRADAATERLTVINSVYTYLDSLAHTTTVINTANEEDDPVQYVRGQFAAALGHEPDPAAHFYWSDLLIRCSNSAQCRDRRTALANYLAAAPPSTFSLTGRVTDENGAALAGTTVTLNGSQLVTTATNGNGEYSFSNLPTSGDYTVGASKLHYTFSTPTWVFTTPLGDQAKDFKAALNRHTLSGWLTTSGGNAVAGATVTLSGTQDAVATADAGGNYSFPNLPAGGTYTLTPSKSIHHFTPQGRTIEDLGGDRVANFTLVTHNIGGRVTSTNGSALVGITVILSGGRSATVTTNELGDYAFTDLPAGDNYTVTPSLVFSSFTPLSRTYTQLGADRNDSFLGLLVPHLMTEEGTDRAVALGSVTFLTGPFPLNSILNFSTDSRTRIVLFGQNLEFTTAAGSSVITAQAEDAQGIIYPLAIEFAGEVPGFSSITQIVVRLSEELPQGVDVWVSINREGISSKKAKISISSSGL
jgi:carboxypeptidase family protein/pectate lyase-like protein